MSTGPVFLWTGARAAGIYPTLTHALDHCKAIANDHRPKPELDELGFGVLRYIGPRGRRHGPRFVAFLLPRLAVEEFSADAAKMLHLLPGEA